MEKLCEQCKRQGRVFCPHNMAAEIRQRLQKTIKQEMFGPSPPHVFVGHNFYPNVYWGPLVSANDTSEDDPTKMYGMDLERIIESRAALVRGMTRSHVMEKKRNLEEAQEAVMSISPVDSEVKFKKPPSFSLEFDSIAHPIGASAPLEKYRMAENPKIPGKVDEFFNESILAQEALQELLASGFDVHYLSKLLSAGILGKKENRKLVPTKWSITATDDMAAKRLMQEIREFRELDEFRVYSNTYLDNHFEILLLPGSWEYEQFEAALTSKLEEHKKMREAKAGAGSFTFAQSAWENWVYDGRINMSEEHEPFQGRAKYAESQGGGYYAARLGVCEALHKMKRQARAVVFREIGTGYTIPVGVWEVRENVRHAFLNQYEKPEGKKQALESLAARLAIPIREYVKQSSVLPQSRLNEF